MSSGAQGRGLGWPPGNCPAPLPSSDQISRSVTGEETTRTTSGFVCIPIVKIQQHLVHIMLNGGCILSKHNRSLYMHKYVTTETKYLSCITFSPMLIQCQKRIHAVGAILE